jgi:hypothetical protein
VRSAADQTRNTTQHARQRGSGRAPDGASWRWRGAFVVALLVGFGLMTGGLAAGFALGDAPSLRGANLGLLAWAVGLALWVGMAIGMGAGLEDNDDA